MNPPSNALPPVPVEIGHTIAVVGVSGWQCCICKTTFERSFSIDHHMITSHHPLPKELMNPTTNADAALGCRPAAYSEESAVNTSLNQCNTAVGDMQALRSNKTDEVVSQGQREVNMDVCGTALKVSERLQGAAPGGDSFQIINPVISMPSLVPSGTRQTVPDEVSMAQGSHVPVKKEPEIILTEAATLQPLRAGGSHTGCPQAGNDLVENLPVHFPAHGHANQGASDQNSPTSPQAKIPRIYSACAVTEARYIDCKPRKRRVCSCGQAFDTKQEFRHHRRVVHCKLNQKLFICPICTASYQYKRGLNRHLAAKGQVAVACDECPQRFHDHESLESHKTTCHGNNGPQGQNNQSRVIGEERPHAHDAQNQGPRCNRTTNLGLGLFQWECSRCKKHFLEKPIFRKHLGECGIMKFIDNKRTFECNLCGAMFPWLVHYHTHYVNDHKLALRAQTANSPAHLDPYHSLDNSPVPSPCPSMTSEINSALADVDLNGQNASSTSVSIISSLSTATTDSSGQQSSNLAIGELNGEDYVNWRGPQSLSSEAGSSDLTKDSDIIILSETEDSVTVDSSSSEDDDDDEEEDWEMISGQSADDVKHKHSEPGFQGMHRGGVFSRGIPHLPRPGAPPFRPPPPPPPPSFDHSFASPRPPFPFFPPHYHHHHRHGHHHHHEAPYGRGWGRFPHGRGMHGPWSWRFHGFGGPGCFYRECDESDEGATGRKQQSETPRESAGGSTLGGDPPGTQPSTNTSDKTSDQSTPTGPSAESSSQGTSASDTCPGAEFFPWSGKTKEGKFARKTMKQIFSSIFDSYKQGRTFLFCPDCMQTFSEESELEAHSKATHSATSQYVCFLCQQGIKSPLDYNRHMRQHYQNFMQMRGRGRGRGGWMMGMRGGFHHFFKHFGKHWGAFWPYQDPCAQGPPLVDSDPDLDTGESGLEEFKECPVCFKKFRANSRENFFERHVNSHFGVETFNYKCDFENCGKTFLEKAKYTAHMATHSAPQAFICSECGKTYQNRTSLTRHQRIHTGERPYKCSDCGEGFIENRDLVRHRAVHTGEAPFKCEECGTGFTLKTSLLTHKRNKHQCQGAFTCISCLQAFPSSAALTKHRAGCSKAGDEAKKETEILEVKQEPAEMELDS